MIFASSSAAAPASLSRAQIAAFDRDGYLIVPGLFSVQQVRALRDRFDALGQAHQSIPGHWSPDPDRFARGDVLGRWPRVMHPHRFDDLSRRMLLHESVHRVLRDLLGEEPVACQSMYYFKPPGARGQALHQDNFYLEVEPSTCIAAWTAIDPGTPDNGGLYVVPGTHRIQIVCPEQAEAGASFTTHLVKAPPGMKAVPAMMAGGDTLFFNGSVVHGSGPNRSTDTWRRSFICHYMPASSRCVSKHYHPILDFAGRELSYEASRGGGPCGDERPSSHDPYGA